MKNIIIGIDGGSFKQINPLLKKELLPNFKKLIDDGFSSNLKVTIPPITIPSWPCLFSGITPEQLGFTFFTNRKKGVLFNSNFWKKYSLFSLPSIRQFVFNVPGTYPAWKINGEMMSGIMSPSLTCYPKELEFIYEKKWIVGGISVSNTFKAFELKKKIFLRKIHEDFDLLIYVIRVPDDLSHVVRKGPKQALSLIELSYKMIDNFLGELLSKKEIKNIMIFSDHGLEVYKKVIYLETWLKKKKLLSLNKKISLKVLLREVFFKFFDILRPLKKLNSFLIESFIKFFTKEKKLFTYKENLDLLPKKFTLIRELPTHIKSYKSNIGGIFLNKKDKSLKERIIAKLKKEKYIKKIISTESEDSPDLYIILKDKFYFEDKASLFVKRSTEILAHSQYGIFIAYGSDIKKGRENMINYYDVAPTILKLFNIEKMPQMIGTPLDIFKNKS